MIQMNHYRNGNLSGKDLHHLEKHINSGIFNGTLRSLHDNGRVKLLRSLKNGLKRFHVIEIKGTHGIVPFVGLLQYLNPDGNRHDTLLSYLGGGKESPRTIRWYS